MAIVLALLTAVLYGTGDFLGGFATKRHSVLQVVLAVQTVGLVGLTLTMPLYGAVFTWCDTMIGAAAGVVGLLGLIILYRGLAIGPMAVIAPLTAVTSAAVPVCWGLLRGERPSVLVAIGIVVGLVAIVVISRAAEDEADTKVSVRTVVEALLAGVGFGLFFVIVSETADESAPWPVFGSRLLTVSILVIYALARGAQALPRPAERTGYWVLLFGGLADTGANVAFQFAANEGDLASVAVLSSMYPAMTVLLALLVFGERLDRPKLIGLALALGAVGLIAGG